MKGSPGITIELQNENKESRIEEYSNILLGTLY